MARMSLSTYPASLLPCLRMATCPNPAAKGASGFVKALSGKLEEYAAESKACLLLETAATELVMEDGVITGVVSRNKDGVETTYTAPSVILATGGYGHNEAWLKEYNFTNVATSAPSTATGAGYDFAKAAGRRLQRHGLLHRLWWLRPRHRL